jgi:RNase adapter protein RapZ
MLMRFWPYFSARADRSRHEVVRLKVSIISAKGGCKVSAGGSDHESEIVVVTGPAGSGRSTAIRALEDLGFEAIDNLPISLLPRLFSGPPLTRPVVVGIDPRNRDFDIDGLSATLEKVAREAHLQPVLVYIDCDASTLIRRYSETRRRHPLSPSETPRVGIEREIALLEPLKARAGVLIDTSALTPHDLRAEIEKLFGTGPGTTDLVVGLESFSYKRGTPRGIDMVIDVRFLRNPHWDLDLRPKNGISADVQAFVRSDPEFETFYDKLLDLLRFLLPAYKAEGKSCFSLGLGCTGGRHRSVTLVEMLAKTLAQEGWRVSTRHRDLARETPAAPGSGVGSA